MGAPAAMDRARLACLRVWTVVGAGVVLAAALAVMGRVSSVLAFLGVGCTVAYVASPLVGLLSRLRCPRPLAALLSVVLVAIGVFLLFALIVPVFFSQMADLLRDLPARIALMGEWFQRLEQDHESLQVMGQYVEVSALVGELQGLLTRMVTGLLSAIGTGIVPAVSNMASALFVVFLALVLAYWIACDYPRINDEICLALGPRRSGDYRLLVAVVSRSVGGYLRTTVIDSLIQGTLAFVGFTLAGHPYAGIMGVLSGVLNFMPVVGPSISASIATLVALFYSPTMALWTLVAAVVAQNVTDNLIVPKINQSTMQIHPVLTLTAIVLGSALMGALGMVLAVPLCAIAKGLFVFYYERRTGTQLVSYDGALFRGTPFVGADGRPMPACDALGDEGLDIDGVEGGRSAASAVPRPKRRWERLVERLRARAGGDEGAGEGDE